MGTLIDIDSIPSELNGQGQEVRNCIGGISNGVCTHGTPACNSCISCKMTIFACIFILEKSRLYFCEDLPVTPVFFQPECRAMPESGIDQQCHDPFFRVTSK